MWKLSSLLLYKYLNSISDFTSWLSKSTIFTVTTYGKQFPVLRIEQKVKFIYFTYCFLLTSSHSGHYFLEFPKVGKEWVAPSKEEALGLVFYQNKLKGRERVQWKCLPKEKTRKASRPEVQRA